ncbi:peroxiredoxin Q/BCP [Methanomicrobium sp. W14]|uniref:thioredoxin-dependent thiol peroxidase n=1 Tax=Methanomicrobium sp. W14 TaxID=2817839 RepID=UPI001AE249B5|nr:thioredoxin-dependent thiol peroxidase [Methanomicrobium sp. W14]MBP2132671.1 peroxiredoxin Q/BCP [Methanomicrobium sp. W14]
MPDTISLKEGKPAPDFCLFDKENKEVCLSVFKGKNVVLYFYPKDNTSACTQEAKSFSKNLETFAGLDAVVIGISPDSCESHKKFSEKNDLNIILLSDPDHRVLKEYGIWKLKKMYGREYMGVERSTFLLSKSGTISHIWRKVRVKGHTDDVMEKLKEIS